MPHPTGPADPDSTRDYLDDLGYVGRGAGRPRRAGESVGEGCERTTCRGRPRVPSRGRRRGLGPGRATL